MHLPQVPPQIIPGRLAPLFKPLLNIPGPNKSATLVIETVEGPVKVRFENILVAGGVPAVTY